MFKLIALVLGLCIGFGAGVYWGVHHPDQASSLSAEEEQRVLEQTQSLRDRIHNLIAKHQGNAISVPAGVPGSSLVNGSSNSGSASVDPDLQELDQKAQAQLDMLKAKLGK